MPALRDAARWATIEPTWGYARALASDLFWQRGGNTSGSSDGTPTTTATAEMPSAATVAMPATPTPVSTTPAWTKLATTVVTAANKETLAPSTTSSPGASTSTVPYSTPLGVSSCTANAGDNIASVAAAETCVNDRDSNVRSTFEDRERRAKVPSGQLGQEGTGGVGEIWTPDPGLYCICRGGDDGGVMVSCEACSEWFHAAW